MVLHISLHIIIRKIWEVLYLLANVIKISKNYQEVKCFSRVKGEAIGVTSRS